MKRSLHTAHDELLRHPTPPRRRRSNPRVIKRKMSSWHLKHAHHRNPPPPDNETITIVPATKPSKTRRKPPN
ncbi:hypothetical protein E1181_30515 [Saccharopolyspora terrae]|uniref:Uncharacterized protein n=1 Tax=Saccharopolyspora terrae TaxID=2530384 RepID=A0A4R4VAA4_9PSEU|nr:hypothetical protein E1181_30515 [Saccharopolyspora terrae]